MKRLFSAVLLLASVAFASAPAPYIVDAAHSQINFIAEAKLISAHGSFDKWQADVSFDPENVESSSVRLTIDAASINTRVERRDQHLRSKDFFDVEKYPEITFVSKKITKAGANRYNIIGDLSLHGVTKEMTIPAEMVFYENHRGRFRGTFQLNRFDFGITYDSRMNPIANAVTVQFDINILNKAEVERQQRERQQQQQQQQKPNS